MPSLLVSPDLCPHTEFIDQALYLPLFYGDANGLVHAGAATEVPSLENRGISADGTTWTFHLRPNLVWSDGQPYDARDAAQEPGEHPPRFGWARSRRSCHILVVAVPITSRES